MRDMRVSSRAAGSTLVPPIVVCCTVLCGYAFVSFSVLSVASKRWHICAQALSRSQTLRPCLLDERVLSFGACFQLQHQHHTMGKHGRLQASSRAIGCQDAIRWTRMHQQGLSRIACASQDLASNVAARYSGTIAVEPEPCIVPHHNLYRLYGSSTPLTRDSTAQQIDQNPPTATLAQVQRTLARLLLAKRYAMRKDDRIAHWVPQSDQGLDDLLPPQRSTTAAALLSVSSGGRREADTRSCLPYPIPPRPRSRATSIQSSLRYARKPIFGGTSHYDARYDADGRDLFGSSRATGNRSAAIRFLGFLCKPCPQTHICIHFGSRSPRTADLL
jgi:hypothetical protein